MTDLSPEQINETISFHGHWCPGLAIGIRASEWALKEMGKAPDEEIVAVVETDMCGVDAIQYLIGCTFGKGNLIHKDYGKNAFSFYRRQDGKAARLVMRPEISEGFTEKIGRLFEKKKEQGLSSEEEKTWYELRESYSRKIMQAGLNELFQIKEPSEPAPDKARILSSRQCQSCGEMVMQSRLCDLNGQILCIPCHEQLTTG